MRISQITASNWRNFGSLDVALGNRLFIVGPNASGKSNFLDIFRFLKDVARPGGGLSSALTERGGLSKVRSLFARNYKNGHVKIKVGLSDGSDTWQYELAIRSEKGERNRPVVAREVVKFNGEVVIERPDASDQLDPERLTQTYMEQISANREFRSLAEYFARVEYSHVVPQIIRNPNMIGSLPSDGYGAKLIETINATPTRTREARLRRVQEALSSAVPEFESLSLKLDSSGRPHLVAGYRNWRKAPAHQSEVDFSDGTLRLVGLLWTLVSTTRNDAVLLLEEPELSLNSAIVRTLPTVFATAQESQALQLVVSTHAPDLLDDEGILPEEVLVLQVSEAGSVAELLSDNKMVAAMVDAEIPYSQIVELLISPLSLEGFMTLGQDKR